MLLPLLMNNMQGDVSGPVDPGTPSTRRSRRPKFLRFIRSLF